jgi:predicted ATPase
LRLYGEREHPVPPLALPDRRANPTAAHLVEFEAVRLFVDRAQAARPDFALSDQNAADIAEICQRLDGLPLAIELAAARIRTLPPRAMLQRMQRRLPLLTGGARDLPARQRTLRDAIAWSYDLLDPGEQILFRRMGVFWGCSLEAAETVCAGEAARPGATSVALPPLEIDVLDGLESLVEKSLVRQAEGVDGQPRYSMLETIREYALERLTESGEADAVHRRHALGALRFAEMADPALYGEEQVHWFARVEQAS